jgi:hypothetical protein
MTPLTARPALSMALRKPEWLAKARKPLERTTS